MEVLTPLIPKRKRYCASISPPMTVTRGQLVPGNISDLDDSGNLDSEDAVVPAVPHPGELYNKNSRAKKVPKTPRNILMEKLAKQIDIDNENGKREREENVVEKELKKRRLEIEQHQVDLETAKFGISFRNRTFQH